MVRSVIIFIFQPFPNKTEIQTQLDYSTVNSKQRIIYQGKIGITNNQPYKFAQNKSLKSYAMSNAFKSHVEVMHDLNSKLYNETCAVNNE